ncbi:MAG: methyltransferase domain-containing protein [Alphaproteobacteria bacterium]
MRDCPACGSAASHPLKLYSRGEWQVCACDACGFVYLKNPPAYERLVDEFAWEKTWAEEKTRRAREGGAIKLLDRLFAFRWRFRRDSGARYRQVFGQGKILDVGCGPGFVLPEPLIPFGIEPSAALHARADAAMRARGGYALFGPAIDRLKDFPEGFFDGVLMSSILEHEANPKALLRGVHRVLADGGKLYLKQPNFGSSNRKLTGAKWCGFRYPDHVNYFTIPQMRRMAEEAGYDFKQLNRFAPFSDNMHVLLTKRA